jgi:hypothetical protein
METNLENKTNNDISQNICKQTNSPSLFWDVTNRVLASVYLPLKMGPTGFHGQSINSY